MFGKKNSKILKYETELARMKASLEIIRHWKLPYPEYEYDYGYVAVQSYMQSVARHGLEGGGIPSAKKPAFQIHEPFHKLCVDALA